MNFAQDVNIVNDKDLDSYMDNINLPLRQKSSSVLSSGKHNGGTAASLRTHSGTGTYR